MSLRGDVLWRCKAVRRGPSSYASHVRLLVHGHALGVDVRLLVHGHGLVISGATFWRGSKGDVRLLVHGHALAVDVVYVRLLVHLLVHGHGLCVLWRKFRSFDTCEKSARQPGGRT